MTFCPSTEAGIVQQGQIECAKQFAQRAANDNGSGESFDHMLMAALRHFGEHGLHAAQDARQRAEAAFFAGESDSYKFWLGICRVIDKRMAQGVEAMGNASAEFFQDDAEAEPLLA